MDTMKEIICSDETTGNYNSTPQLSFYASVSLLFWFSGLEIYFMVETQLLSSILTGTL